MALHIPPGYWQCKLRWQLTGDNEEIISTIGVRGNEPGDRDIVEVAHAVWDAWDGAFTPNGVCNVYAFVGVDVTEGSDDGTGNVASWDQRRQGDAATAPLPQNCTILVKKRTALGGRANVGRMFLPPAYLGEGDVDHVGDIGAQKLSQLVAGLDQFWANLTDSITAPGQPIADFWPVLFHNNPTPTPTDLVGFALSRRIATQRQRLRR